MRKGVSMEQLTSNKFDEVINSKQLSVVDFSATWCMPCRMLKPILERTSEKFADIKFYNLDIDDSEEIAKRYRIFSVPTIVCFREGRKIDSMVGLSSADEIEAFVNRCANTKLEN